MVDRCRFRLRAGSVVLAAALLCALAARAYDVSPSGELDGTDSAAIQAAIDAAGAAGGNGKVTLADGFYHIATVIRLTNAVELVGNDADRSQVIFDAANANGVHLLYVQNSRAFAHGIRFQNSYNGSSTDVYYRGPIYITGGTVSNCTVKMSKASKFCGGVGMSAGTIVDCDITGCGSTDGGGARIGGALRLYGATCVADRLVITNNSAKAGAGAYLQKSGAKLLNSLVADNSAGTDAGGGVHAAAGTVVSNCVIRGNKAGNGAGLYGSCDVYDSLVVGNVSSGTGGGFYKGGGTMRGCTVAGNTAGVSCAGVYQTGGDILDSILWYNGSSVYLTAEDSLSLNGGTCTYSCAVLAGSGAGNITDKTPAFVDPANGDYRLAAASPCRGKAKDGASDMGYYKFSAATTPRVAFTYAIADGKAPASATFTAQVEGATATGWSWDFGDGTAPDTTSGATATHAFASAGRYTVTLTVSTAGGDLVYAAANAINLGSDTVYVNADGNDTFPYADSTTAATSIPTALAAVICSAEKPGRVMIVGDKTISHTGDQIILDKPVEIVGRGKDLSTIQANESHRAFYVKHAQAVLAGVTVKGGYCSTAAQTESGGLLLDAGTVTNCSFVKSHANYIGSVCLNGTGAKLLDCEIRDGYNKDGLGAGRGGGLYMTAGLVSGCVISNCECKSQGGGAFVTGGVISNSVIRDCFVNSGYGVAGGIYLTGSEAKAYGLVIDGCKVDDTDGTGGGGAYVTSSALLANSVVTNCSVGYVSGGGVYLAGGTVTGCVVAACTAKMGSGGGICQTGGSVLHCTVARNNAKADGSGIRQNGPAAVLRDTVLADNGDQSGYTASDLSTAAGTVTYCRAREFDDGDANHNIGAAPLFRDSAKLDFRLRSTSPCRDAASDGSDMGAIPYVYDPTAEAEILINVKTDGSCHPVTATLTCTVDGELPSAISEYVWTFGDGTSETVATNGVLHVYGAVGSYVPTLKLVLENGEERTAKECEPLKVYSSLAWVDADNANPVSPYDTEAKAANTIGEALGVVVVPPGGHATVKVKAGRYPQSAGQEWLLTTAVHLLSASGRRDVVIDGQSARRVVIEARHADSLVSGLVVSNTVNAYGDYGALWATGGTFSNCEVRTIRETSSGFSGGGQASGTGRIAGCSFVGCYATDGNLGGIQGIGAIYMKGGTVEDCFVTNCSGSCNVGGILIDGGTLRRTLIAGCSGRGSLLQRGGLVENCRVLGCTANKSGAYGSGAVVTAGTNRNSFVRGNSSTVASAGVVASGSALVENCTVAYNVGVTYAGMVSGSGATWVNALSWGNSNAAGEANPDSVGAGTFDHCLWGRDPRFRKPVADGRIGLGSPACEAGVWRDWMTGATDLHGRPRKIGTNPDVGCAEARISGCAIVIP